MIREILTPFGVEVRGILIDALHADKANDMLDLISRNRVAVFRDQSSDDDGLVRFLEMFGELTFTTGEMPVEGFPLLNVVSNVGRSTPPRSVFHTDTSYVDRPPAFTALRPVRLPKAGGSTLFSDQVAAWRRLSPRIRDMLRDRTVLHRTTGLDGRNEARRHPLFRKHPVTGETALYLSTPERCSGLSGVDDVTGARIVSMLYRHSIKPALLYRHRWRSGDLIVWDNRVTMHRADHEGVDGDRVLHRGMILGEVPIAA